MSVSKIAEKAGVSIATVSRVMNNSRPVNPEMAELVRNAMKELQLTAKPRRARSKSTDRHTTVAIVSLGQSYRGWFELPVIAGVVGELTRAAQEQHMGILMAEMPDAGQLSPVLRRPEVSGAIVFMSSNASPAHLDSLRQHLPLVRVMGGQVSPVQIDHIGVDNNAVGYVAAKYLLERGLRNLAFLSQEPTWDFCKLRAQGFIAAAEEQGVVPASYVRAESKTPLAMFGPKVIAHANASNLVQQIAQGGNGPVGLFVPRDEETVLVYRLLSEAGVRIGQDVVVVSCDNEEVRLSTLHPRPASIDLVPAEIARHAIRRLASRIKHRDEPPVRILVNPRLVTPESEAGQRRTTDAAFQS
jgi:LacI family transcriptional regulator